MKKILPIIALLFISSFAFSQITLTSTVTNVSCFGGSNGSATVTATGGTAPYTYTWLPGNSSPTTLTSATAGQYTIMVEDAAANTNSLVITIIEPSILTASATATNALCFGTATGAIDIYGGGGTPTYSYNLNGGPFQTSSSYTNLNAGLYTVGIKDANNCIATQTVQVNQPTALNIVTNAQNANCMAANGIVTTTVTGGTPIYTYNWTGGGAAATLSNVTAGTYTLTVTDANGCTAVAPAVIGLTPAGLAVITSSSNVTCNGSCDGNITVGMVGGAAPFTYMWSPSGQTTSTSTNLCPGTYTCTITDFYGCTSSIVATLTQPSPLGAIVTSNNVICYGTATGTINVAGTGGVSPYTYLWPTLTATLTAVGNIAAGMYPVIVTDANGCSKTQTVNVTQPPALTAVVIATNANCGQANGSVCISVSGGTGAVTYQWSNGSTALCNNNIPAGAFTCTVTDANGCIANANGLVNDIAGPSVSITSQTNITCFGLFNGGATASIAGGVPNYNISWSGNETSANTTTSTSNFGTGIHNIIVTDAAGCVGTASVIITQPTQLNTSLNANYPTCFGQCNGSLTAVCAGGTPPYSYSWTGTGGNTPTSNLLCAGNYGATITDSNGCISTQSINLSQPPQMTAVASLTNASCGGACDGAITMLVMGGTGGYSYIWTPNIGIGSMTWNLCTGIYTLQVKDFNDCSVTNVINILSGVNNTIPNATITSIAYNETCFLSFDGAIDLNITGSNTGPFTYQWSSGDTTQDLVNIHSDLYWVTITDANSNCLTLIDTVIAIGTNCGTISGNIFIDNNGDCIKNTGDYNFSSAPVIINPGNRHGVTNYNGDYIINNLPYGTYSVSLNMNPSGSILPSCTTTITANINSGILNSGSNDLTAGFNSGTQPDLNVSAWNGGIVPGFVCRMNYNLNNLNNVNGTGLFKVTLPSAFIPNITNAYPSNYTVSGDTVIWPFSNVVYNTGSTYFYVDFTTPLSTTLGSIFTSCMYAQPNITDFDLTNNNYCYQRIVNGSFDPNEKTVSPVGVGANGDIAATVTDLTYLIQFQNTGNGPAVNIMVKDTLSPNVDITTFEMLSSSHNYNIDILDGNILRWKFNNIMLADSNTNEPASHGYIQYRIKRTNNNTPGTQIKNTAYIYFDFNEPVVTNTAINTIETVTGIKSQNVTDNDWNVYPNPSTGSLYIVNHSSFKEQSQIQVLNSIGQTVFEETITGNYKNIDLSKLNNGIYFVKIVSDKQSCVKRIVLSK